MIDRTIVQKLNLELVSCNEGKTYNMTEKARWNEPRLGEVVFATNHPDDDMAEGTVYRVTVRRGMMIAFMIISENALLRYEYEQIVELVSKLAEHDFARLANQRESDNK